MRMSQGPPGQTATHVTVPPARHDASRPALLPAMRALAMLPPVSQVRVQAAVSPPSELSVRLLPAHFVDAIERGWPDIAVLDPLLSRGVGSIPAALHAAHTPSVLYICLTPEHAQAATEFVRMMPAPVITLGYGDDTRALTEVLALSGRATRGALLLDRIAQALSRLPRHVANGVAEANRSHTRVTSTEQLACYCGVHRASLARLFAQASLAPASHLVAVLGLVQEYAALANRDVPLAIVAHRLGLTSARTLDARCTAASGYSARDVRAGISLERFCDACASRLMRD